MNMFLKSPKSLKIKLIYFKLIYMFNQISPIAKIFILQALQELGYTSATELQAGIKKLNCNIRKIKNLIASQQDEPQVRILLFLQIPKLQKN